MFHCVCDANNNDYVQVSFDLSLTWYVTSLNEKNEINKKEEKKKLFRQKHTFCVCEF